MADVAELSFLWHIVAPLALDLSAVALVTELLEDRFQRFRETKVSEESPKPVIPDRVIAAHFGPHLDLAEDLVAMFEPGAPTLARPGAHPERRIHRRLRLAPVHQADALSVAHCRTDGS